MEYRRFGESDSGLSVEDRFGQYNRYLRKLGITFKIIDMISQCRALVVKELMDRSCNGIIVNLNILCNVQIKFDMFKKYTHANCLTVCNWALLQGNNK
jgi:tRNA U34 2-thiouridine synthase MnmA/TrmU